MSLLKPQAEALSSILESGGVVASSEWTNGSGRHITRRTVPPYCELLEAWQAESHLRGEVRRSFERLRRMRPRIQRVVAVTDLRGARRAMQEATR
jgi:hypothetical protein